MKTYMFPGQGAQAKGMGGSLFDEFGEVTAKADNLLGYSIKELCLEDPRNELNQTQFTQPALYVVNCLSYLKEVEESGQKPDFLVGHSLGEFNALFAAECFDFEAGLKLVKKRGELMSLATDGGMAAVLNATEEEIKAALEENGLENVDLANYNSPFQIVLSGATDDLAGARAILEAFGARFHPLKTSGAFHSRLMQPAREKFETYLKRFRLSGPKVPVISNVTARPYDDDEIVLNLANQIASPVRWSDSIMYLLELESNGDDSMEFKELGHGDVLTKLVDKIKKEMPLVGKGTSKAGGRQMPLKRAHERQVDTNGSQMPTEAAAKDGGPGNRGPEIAEEATASEDPKESSKVLQNQSNGDAKDGMEHADRDQHKGTSIFVDAERKVQTWNQTHPVGTKVKSLTMDYDELETRTEAVVLFGHRAAVYMKGYNGYFDLDEIKPL